jgi:hypothetical protein
MVPLRSAQRRAKGAGSLTGILMVWAQVDHLAAVAVCFATPLSGMINDCNRRWAHQSSIPLEAVSWTVFSSRSAAKGHTTFRVEGLDRRSTGPQVPAAASVRCLVLVAPTIGAATVGLRSTQASAIWTMGTPSSRATSWTASAMVWSSLLKKRPCPGSLPTTNWTKNSTTATSADGKDSRALGHVAATGQTLRRLPRLERAVLFHLT